MRPATRDLGVPAFVRTRRPFAIGGPWFAGTRERPETVHARLFYAEEEDGERASSSPADGAPTAVPGPRVLEGNAAQVDAGGGVSFAALQVNVASASAAHAHRRFVLGLCASPVGPPLLLSPPFVSFSHTKVLHRLRQVELQAIAPTTWSAAGGNVCILVGDPLVACGSFAVRFRVEPPISVGDPAERQWAAERAAAAGWSQPSATPPSPHLLPLHVMSLSDEASGPASPAAERAAGPRDWDMAQLPPLFDIDRLPSLFASAHAAGADDERGDVLLALGPVTAAAAEAGAVAAARDAAHHPRPSAVMASPASARASSVGLPAPCSATPGRCRPLRETQAAPASRLSRLDLEDRAAVPPLPAGALILVGSDTELACEAPSGVVAGPRDAPRATPAAAAAASRDVLVAADRCVVLNKQVRCCSRAAHPPRPHSLHSGAGRAVCHPSVPVPRGRGPIRHRARRRHERWRALQQRTALRLPGRVARRSAKVGRGHHEAAPCAAVSHQRVKPSES